MIRSALVLCPLASDLFFLTSQLRVRQAWTAASHSALRNRATGMSDPATAGPRGQRSNIVGTIEIQSAILFLLPPS